MSNTAKFIAAIAAGDKQAANESFAKAMKTRVNTVLDIKRIAITSAVYEKASK